jgi:hypothetical protein
MDYPSCTRYRNDLQEVRFYYIGGHLIKVLLPYGGQKEQSENLRLMEELERNGSLSANKPAMAATQDTT